MTISGWTIRHIMMGGLTAAAMPAIAAAGPLQVTSSVMVEHRAAAADGTTRIALVKAVKVAPGDRVVFVTTYANTGRQPIADLVLADPIPASIAYRAPRRRIAGARPVGRRPQLRPARDAQGSTPRRRYARGDPDDVTAVRWRLTAPLAPGAHGELAFRAILK